MNSLIEYLNHWGERFFHFAGPMLWQSSLLIMILFALDFLLRRKLRAVVRYTLWLVVLVKLLLPPTLALPTGVAWWLRPTPPTAKPETRRVIVTYGNNLAPITPTVLLPQPAMPPPKLSLAGQAAASTAVISLGLLGWMIFRWRQVARVVRVASPATDALNDLLDDGRRSIGLRRNVRLRVTDLSMSPAVCGLFRPVILLPRSLAQQLPPNQLRAVLLHELVHLKRGDVWVNCAQALLQIFYWWHPLLWFANARIRRVREEAVDDAVMLALRDDADTYAPTLLDVAKLAFNRPLASLGLVGILESRSALRQRVERLVNFRPPRTVGLTFASVLCVLLFAALAVPMAKAPLTKQPRASSDEKAVLSPVPTDGSTNANSSKIKSLVLVQKAAELLEAGKLDEAEAQLKKALAVDPDSRAAYYYLELLRERRGSKATHGRRAIVKKLNEIRLDSISFDRVPLPKVVRLLESESMKHDPDKHGINFIINPSIARTIDPTTGLPLANKLVDDIKSVSITIKHPLTNLRLVDALNAVMMCADKPIQYAIKDYAIVISRKGEPEPEKLYARRYHVDASTLHQGLQYRGFLSASDVTVPFEDAPVSVSKQNGGASRFVTRTNSVNELKLSVAVRNFFVAKGVDLQSPKYVFYADQRGELLVRATLDDFERIEQAIQELNHTPPQINIKARFVEIPEGRTAGLFLGALPTNIRNAITGTGAGSNSSSVFPGYLQSGALVTPIGTNQIQTSVFSAQFAGVLTEPEYRIASRTLEQRKGVELLSCPEVTTVSGRQAQIQVVDLHTIFSGINPQALAPPGIVTQGTTNSLLQSQVLPIGPVLDVIPYLTDDGYTLNLTVIPTITEFLGYEKSSNLVAVYVNGQKTKELLPQPRFRIRQMTATVTMQDGQTLVLGHFPDQVVSKKPNGEMEAKEFTNIEKKHLLVFITPTIVDSAGNRIHSDDGRPPKPN